MPEAGGLPFNIYITLRNPVMITAFINKHPPQERYYNGEAHLLIWHVDWMDVHLDYATVEQVLSMMPKSEYHLLCFGDAFDEAGEMGEFNVYRVTLERKVTYMTT